VGELFGGKTFSGCLIILLNLGANPRRGGLKKGGALKKRRLVRDGF